MKRKLYQELASLVVARLNCIKANNTEWHDKHEESIELLVKEHMPSGSGFNSGTSINLEECTPTRLVFETGFHHMNDGGMYDGWTEHKVIITPSFDNFDMRVTGRNRNDIKNYIAETFSYALTQGVST